MKNIFFALVVLSLLTSCEGVNIGKEFPSIGSINQNLPKNSDPVKMVI